MSTELRFSPFDPDVIADPYPAYAALRAAAPVYYADDDDLWIVSRYHDVVSIVRDPETFSSARGMGTLTRGTRTLGDRQPLDDLARLRVLIATDPPDHTAMRRLVSRAFTPRVVSRLEVRARAICKTMVEELLAAGEQGEADLVQHVAYPFPVTVIAELLGIPPERRADFKRWSDGVVGTLSGTADPDLARQVGSELFGYFAEVVQDRTTRPGPDLISQLVTGGRNGDVALSVPEIVMFCILLLIAGNETTTNLIGNATQAMWSHPDQLERLCADRSLVHRAIEEALRYCGPVQGLFRGTTRSVDVSGTTIPADTLVLILFASANRDEAVFVDPDRFDIGRDATSHIGFGWGIHHCLGAQLARLEARIVAETMLDRLRTLEPAGPPTPVDSFLLRGCRRLPVRVTPR